MNLKLRTWLWIVDSIYGDYDELMIKNGSSTVMFKKKRACVLFSGLAILINGI